MYHVVQLKRNPDFAIMPRKKDADHRQRLLDACLAGFIRAGTLDLSLDALAKAAKTSKRMLIHYFGSREALEQIAMSLLEDRLRARFHADAFPSGASARSVLLALWDQVTSPASRGILLLTMDLTRRSWSGSERARNFFEEQQRLWSEMLARFLPNAADVEAMLQLFQGAVLVYLVTGDRERGKRALDRLLRGMSEL
jgi:AcrR family transcriptional regulator